MAGRPFALVALVAGALLGFAGNSLLTRLGLAERAIDAASFTAVRLGSGALVLAAILTVRRGPRAVLGAGSKLDAALLVGYAAPFSLAYLSIGAGVGALILFGAVQLTMIGWAIAGGDRPSRREWLGLALALGGLATLALPGADAPEPLGVALMVIAGAAWGGYSLRGRRTTDPLAATTGNFVRSAPLAVVWLAGSALVAVPHASGRGLVLAATSGGLASGLGYTLWYAALPRLGATRAAILQLVTPVLAGAAAIALLGERPTARLGLAAALILGGVALALVRRRG